MMSNLFSGTFTIINQIPQSQAVPTKIKWKKHFIERCNRQYGIKDASTGTMAYKANAFVVNCKDVETFINADWIDGYYTLPDDEKDKYWTASSGDLLIFAKVDDVEPATVAEFQSLVNKYKDIGGTLTAVNPYITINDKGEPTKTSNIEMIKG